MPLRGSVANSLGRKAPTTRRHKPTIISRIERHALRNPEDTAHTSLQGMDESVKQGNEMGKGEYKTKFYAAPAERVTETAIAIAHGMLCNQGAVYIKRTEKGESVFPKQRDALGLTQLERTEFSQINKLRKAAKSRGETDYSVLRKWLDGKVRVGVPNPIKIADEIIYQSSLRLGQRLAGNKKAKKLQLLSITHSYGIEAVFERLTGIKAPEIMGENKFMEFSHHRDGRITLTAFGKTYDITERFNKVVSGMKKKKNK